MSAMGSTAILGLAWFAAVNAIASLAAIAIAAWFVDDRVRGDVRRARLLVALRLAPVLLSAIVAGALFAPAHYQLEPVNAGERYGALPLALAAAAVILLARSVWRCAVVAAAAVRLSRLLPRSVAGSQAPQCVEVPLIHGIALAGVVRTRVLIGRGVRELLTPGELDVAIAHEVAHQQARDNLMRVLIACVPDFLGLTRSGRRIGRAWENEAECLADARAAEGCADRANQLASALVTVARLGPPAAVDTPAWSAFHTPALLETRVHLLIDGDPRRVPDGRSPGALPGALAAATATVAAWGSGLPAELHYLTEILLARLP